MNIDLSKMRHFWYEDAQGNVLDLEHPDDLTSEQIKRPVIYHSEFPCQFCHDISIYDYHPEGLQKWLIKLPWIGNRIKASLRKTYKHVGTIRTTYSGGADCIVAMVNSGDYTLEQAIWVYCHACERCMNVLAYKYLNGEDGYPENSDEWKQCNTLCDFCKEANTQRG